MWFENQHFFISCSSSAHVRVSLHEFCFIFLSYITDIFMGFTIARVPRAYLGIDSGSQNAHGYGSAEKES